MNSKVILALFCLVAVSLAAAGTTTISCQTTGTVCNDAGCGRSGAATDNWQASGDKCVVTDCASLIANGAVVSDNACASCNTSANPATIVANSDKSACVVKTSAKLLIASAAIILALLF